MNKNHLILLVLLFSIQKGFAQLLHPEQFLGYPTGSRYTPHWKLVDYFKHVAANAGDKMKLQLYGETYEGRPLYIAYISSPSNINRLESIRQNNLKLAQQAEDNKAASLNTPVLVWLSYNVHGNETSSSEASMLTLYSLVDPTNTQTQAWLNNTLIIIDPCLNPDGRDRYVNWFNSVVGKEPNPLPDAKEHDEPWPGGRTNHYNFDLNRDWAWQTQIESQQRMPLYNQWLPQIHVDFHEQSINSPYYFAPAAQPYHEVITPWQRSFQEIIGRNHARYFDERGWLYFTKEVFDLLYPSYGDTYPTYNGSIGMTYEQAGGGSAGKAVITKAGDTLTLHDRILHHYTTSLSTIEVASKNSAKLIQEFQRFFANAVAKGAGEYKSFVVKNTPRDAQRIAGLINILDKNGIKYGTARTITFQGYNYSNGRLENVTTSSRDLVISALQPRGTLVSVLFEPNTRVVDSNTYDITAWSLPYAFGLQAFATKQNIAVTNSFSMTNRNINAKEDAYGYVFGWNGIQSVKLLSQLVQKGFRVRFSKQPFETGGKKFERGAIIVLKASNGNISNLWNTLGELADSCRVELTAVRSGFVDKGYDFGSSSVSAMRPKQVAVLTGEGISSNAAGEVWHFFEQQIDYPLTRIDVSELSRINLDQFDVLVMPDGNYHFLAERSVAELKSWIQKGGNLIALEGAVAQLSKLEWSIKTKKEDTSAANDPYVYLRKYENRERDFIPNVTPGSIFKVELDNTHPLAFGYPTYYYTLKQDNAIYEFIAEDGWNVGILKKEKQMAGFVGSKIAKRFQDGLLFGTQELGEGTIVYLTDNVLFRGFWEAGKLMFANAVFFVGQ